MKAPPASPLIVTDLLTTTFGTARAEAQPPNP